MFRGTQIEWDGSANWFPLFVGIRGWHGIRPRIWVGKLRISWDA